MSATVPLALEDARALWSPETVYLNTASYGLPPRPACGWARRRRWSSSAGSASPRSTSVDAALEALV